MNPSTNANIPTNKIYFVPICTIIIPAIPVPIVVPKLQEVKNNPLAKSGELGAEDIIQY